METKICPKCGKEVHARFIINHNGENGREGEYKWVCDACDEIIDRLKIVIAWTQYVMIANIFFNGAVGERERGRFLFLVIDVFHNERYV